MYDLVWDHFLETPSLFFPKDEVVARAVAIRNLTASLGYELFYPVKAFSNPDFLSLIESHIDGFDVSSLEEAKKISSHKKISVYSPHDSYGAAGKIIEYGMPVQDVILEHPILHSKGARENVFYRLNISPLSPQKEPSRFGVHPLDFHLLAEERNFHFHLRNPQEFSAVEFLEIIQKLRIAFPKMERLIMGGGWHKFSWAEFAAILREVRNANPDLQLRIEPGKLFVHELGYAATKILTKKMYGDSVDIIVDLSSVTHTLWSVPQLMKSEINTAPEPIQLTIYGPSCYEADIVGRYKISKELAQKLSVGSRLIFSGVTGYTAERQHSFNGILPATIHFI